AVQPAGLRAVDRGFGTDEGEGPARAADAPTRPADRPNDADRRTPAETFARDDAPARPVELRRRGPGAVGSVPPDLGAQLGLRSDVEGRVPRAGEGLEGLRRAGDGADRVARRQADRVRHRP